MSYIYKTLVREEGEPPYTYAEVQSGKIVAINKHWVGLEEYRTFFEPNIQLIDITNVTLDGVAPQLGDTVSPSGEIISQLVGFTPNDLKNKKIEELRLERNKRELEPLVLTKGDTSIILDSDKDANLRLSKARQMLEDSDTESIIWTTYDNVCVELTLDDFKAINTLQAIRSDELHKRYNALKDYINSVEEQYLAILSIIDWDFDVETDYKSWVLLKKSEGQGEE